MNSLKFINEKIKMHHIGIDSAVKIIKEFDGIVPVESYKKLVEEHLKEIQILEQIKFELEAWEVVKNKLNLKVQTEEAVTEGFCMKGFWLLVEQFPYTQTTILEQKEYDILKKALEVDNSVQWVEYTLKDFKSVENE